MSRSSRPAAIDVFTAAARRFVELVEAVPPQRWDGPGLGAWDLRALVGHTTRSATAVVEYLRQPADDEQLDTAGFYLAARAAGEADEAFRVERGRLAGAELGGDPARSVRTLVEHAIRIVGGVPDDPLIRCRLGGMRLSNYLPTRVVELVVHGVDIAAATDQVANFDDPAIAMAGHVAIDVAVRRGDGLGLLSAMYGRCELPGGYSVL